MNKCTKILGIRHPIIQAPMAGGATTPELVAAVSNAGGLGSLGAGYMKPDDIRQAIKRIRTLTDKPFSVNLFIPGKYTATSVQIQKAGADIQQCCIALDHQINPVTEPYEQSFDEQIKVILEEKVPVFSFTFGIPNLNLIEDLKSAGTVLIGTATTLDEAILLEKNKVDMVVAQGLEAGGHRGTFLESEEKSLIPLSDLISRCDDQLKIPLIAAGGIMNGSDTINLLSLGASAVQIGTAFLSCHESGINETYKKKLLHLQQDDTVLTRAFSGKLARGIRNHFTRCMESKSENILDYPIQNALTRSMRNKAKLANNGEFMSLWAGQSAHFCQDISAKQLMNKLISEIEKK